jgi:hypothetical protein
MSIEFKKVTWYSQLSAIVLAILIFGLGFYFGGQNRAVKQIVSDGPITREVELLTEVEVKNGIYPFGNDLLKYKDGKYVSDLVNGTIERIILSDLISGDSQTEAVVVTAVNTGGTGVFYSLNILTKENGVAKVVASADLGDRIILNKLSVSDGVIILDSIDHGPDDPMCCPTRPHLWKFSFKDNKLIEL